MAGYQHKEGKGRIFKNTDRKSEKHPHFSGSAMWKGEEISISGWAVMGEDGKLKQIDLSVQEPWNKGDGKPQTKGPSRDDDWGL